MKKVLIAIFLIAMVSVTLFAELVVIPNLGFGSHYTKTSKTTEILGTKTEIKGIGTVSSFLIGLDAFYDLDSGIFIGLANDVYFPFSGSGKLETTITAPGGTTTTASGSSSSKVKGFGYNGRLLGGYALAISETFSIRLAGGLGFGYSSTKSKAKDADWPENDKGSYAWLIGVALDVTAEYKFTPVVGIALTLADTIGYGKNGSNDKDGSPKENDRKGYLANAFTVKIGPSFTF